MSEGVGYRSEYAREVGSRFDRYVALNSGWERQVSGLVLFYRQIETVLECFSRLFRDDLLVMFFFDFTTKSILHRSFHFDFRNYSTWSKQFEIVCSRNS